MICVIRDGAVSSLMFGIPVVVIDYLWSSTEQMGTQDSFVLMVFSSPPTFAMVTEVFLPLSRSKSVMSEQIRLTRVPVLRRIFASFWIPF